MSQSGADSAVTPGPAPERLFIVQHGLQDYHSHYYGETRGWQAACRARRIEPHFYINQRAPAEMVREFDARPVFPFASDVIVERDPECRQLSDFLMLANRFARAAGALEADGLTGSDLVLVPFATERDIFGAALWLQRLAPERRPTLGFIFLGPDLRWQISEDRAKVNGDFSYHRYAVRRLRAILPAEKILIFAVDGRLRNTLEGVMAHPCTAVPLGTHYFDEADLSTGATFNHAHIRIMGEFRPEKGSELIPYIIAAFGARRPGRRISIQANNHAGAQRLLQTLNRKNVHQEVEVIYGDRSGHMRHEDYLRRLIASDILLLPYYWQRYAMRSSGVFSEAVGFGLVTVVPDRTWMADRLTAGLGAGTVFSSFGVEPILAALLAASDDYASLKEKAKTTMALWRRTRSTASTLEAVLRTFASSGAPARPGAAQRTATPEATIPVA